MLYLRFDTFEAGGDATPQLAEVSSGMRSRFSLIDRNLFLFSLCHISSKQCESLREVMPASMRPPTIHYV